MVLAVNKEATNSSRARVQILVIAPEDKPRNNPAMRSLPMSKSNASMLRQHPNHATSGPLSENTRVTMCETLDQVVEARLVMSHVSIFTISPYHKVHSAMGDVPNCMGTIPHCLEFTET